MQPDQCGANTEHSVTLITHGPIACDLSQLSIEDRQHLLIEVQTTFSQASALHALADGFAIEFPSEHGTVARLGEIIEFDRRCCPFIRHALIDEPWGGAIRLELTGPDEVKAFIKAELVPLLPPALISSSGIAL